MSASDVSICNLALQKLGAKRITSLTEDSPNARTMNACYEAIRDAELRKHRWNFAIRRESLAEDSSAPTHGQFANQFTLPSDFLRLLEPDPEENLNTHDWTIEGKKILTNYDAPLEVRFIYRVEDPNEYDSLFVMVLACALAMHTCEDVTQSTAKFEKVSNEYAATLRDAKRTNAIEQVSGEPPVDTWDTARL